MGKHLRIENKIQLSKIQQSNSKVTNEKVGKIFHDIHNQYVPKKTVRMVFKDRKKKIKAFANLQITLDKNLRNTDEIEFMDYRGRPNIAESFFQKNFDYIGTFDDLGNPLCTGRLYCRKFFAKLRRPNSTIWKQELLKLKMVILRRLNSTISAHSTIYWAGDIGPPVYRID
jgi:hypothetical protein